MTEFYAFPKIARFSREMVITEKLDGTNAQVSVSDNGLTLMAGSRNRWLTPEEDNFGFASWCRANEEELLKLGPGRHYGEWWGRGIQRGYGLAQRHFSLFNVGRWNAENPPPACCLTVPILYRGPLNTLEVDVQLRLLAHTGSVAAPGFKSPEGIIIFHTAAGVAFKKTFDDEAKGEIK